jgi:hypothetical protein
VNDNNVSHATSRHFRNKKVEYLQEKINELRTDSKKRNIGSVYRGINEFKKG